jgi:hypothetical protein
MNNHPKSGKCMIHKPPVRMCIASLPGPPLKLHLQLDMDLSFFLQNYISRGSPPQLRMLMLSNGSGAGGVGSPARVRMGMSWLSSF